MLGVVSAIEQAKVRAGAAATRAGVQIVELDSARAQADARWIFDQVWPTVDGSTQVRPNLLRAIVHAGGYCVAAFDTDTHALLGATLAILGQTHDPRGLGAPPSTAQYRPVTFLHSHMAGVVATARNRHIGTAMKLHQRWWALARDIPVVTWTFDPLVRRNARLNLCNLGVLVARYHVNFYGEMHDAINAGDPTDRVVAWWDLDSERAEAAAAGALGPISHDAAVAAAGTVELVDTPEDIVTLRTADSAAAQYWRLRMRGQLVEAFDRGRIIDAITDQGSYVLRSHS